MVFGYFDGNLYKRWAKSIKKNTLKVFLVVSFLLATFIGYGVYWAFYDMSRLPTGEFLTEETSPDGKYTVKAYVANGGATVPYAIRG
ncbi:DUF5412 family protein, partial [Sporosarcina sp. P3]|uniref:DUF5412 family protein n=1 Tax=Sporosarcina sp. P3 TaxID=2048245 RepID=UPI001E2BC11F